MSDHYCCKRCGQRYDLCYCGKEGPALQHVPKSVSDTVSCKHCGKPTPMTGTQQCDHCHELDRYTDAELKRELQRREHAPLIQQFKAKGGVTVYVNPPIPMRDLDWVAYREGAEEDGNYGRGATEYEAIKDLLAGEDGTHDR
jgi:hypothetical protein